MTINSVWLPFFFKHPGDMPAVVCITLWWHLNVMPHGYKLHLGRTVFHLRLQLIIIIIFYCQWYIDYSISHQNVSIFLNA